MTMVIFWGIFGLSLLIIDAVTSILLLSGYGLASIITMALAIFTPFYMQVLIFAVSGTLISLYIIPKLRKTQNVQTYEESLIDITFTAKQPMLAGKIYQEKVKGVYWNIISDNDIALEQTLRVKDIDKKNNLLKVIGEN